MKSGNLEARRWAREGVLQPALSPILPAFARQKRPTLETGPGCFPAALVAEVAPRRALILVEEGDPMAEVLQDLRCLSTSQRPILPFPGPTWTEDGPLPLRWADTVARIRALEALNSRAGAWIVASIEALLAPTLSPKVYARSRRRLKLGEEVDRDEFLRDLVDLGFRREDRVTAPGEFSSRGGIVDVFPLQEPYPIRIEFFGDELETLRRFDPASQRSQEDVESLRLGLAWELPERGSLRRLADKGDLSAAAEDQLRDILSDSIEEGKEAALAAVDSISAPLWEHFPEDAPVISFWTSLDLGRIRRRLPDKVGDDPLEALADQLEDREVWDLGGAGIFSPKAPLDLGVRKSTHYYGEVPRALEELHALHKDGATVVLAGSEKGRLDRLAERLEELSIPIRRGVGMPAAPGEILMLPVDLGHGFQIPEHGFHLFTLSDLFGARALRGEQEPGSKRKQKDRGARFADFSELEEGCLVVHVDHGIGTFLGVKPMLVDGARQDFLELEYAKGDKLFVPSDQLDRVQRFIGVEGGRAPKPNRLNSTRWAQTRAKVREDVEEVAQKLLELYAERSRVPGTRFSPDSVWQRELEASFPFEDTRDQARAAQEVKQDMESPFPMDRLVCGDVGFGKTEVAVRAAFKAVQDGYQVAVLVPTTILAQQHFQTFSERLSDFPVKVGVLSRLRDPDEIKDALKKAKEGKLDILVGTHRILSKDVRFQKLGLLIVDEEQRFGVKHKEKIKELKTTVDVLTLTATPIPRTLNLALSGARDISTITTPPRGRLPVKTYVQPDSSAIVRAAIEKELSRAGQVFFVHNRIQTLGAKVDWIQRLVPHARVRGGHAQMDRKELENLMLDFHAGDFDVLVSTTIVESGLDIPNVNTILVDRSDRLGLAQLYQLRGRVGRTNRQAYAYLLYPADHALSELAYQRLKALEDHSDLGSGFRVAMRDLELRGAGSILGVEQHGFVNSVGFELYTKLLREAVERLKAGSDKHREPTRIELPVASHLPEAYIEDYEERLRTYRRLAEIESLEELEELQDELNDRFGSIPREARGLFDQVRLKLEATELGFESLRLKGVFLEAEFHEKSALDSEAVDRLMRKFRSNLRFRPKGLTLNTSGQTRSTIGKSIDFLFAQVRKTQARAKKLSE